MGIICCMFSLASLIQLNIIGLACNLVPALAFINMQMNDTKRNREIFFQVISVYLVIILVVISIVMFSELAYDKAEDLCQKLKEEGKLARHHYSSVMDCERRIKRDLFFSTIIGIPMIGVLFWHWSTVAHTYYQNHGNTSPETSESEEDIENRTRPPVPWHLILEAL